MSWVIPYESRSPEVKLHHSDPLGIAMVLRRIAQPRQVLLQAVRYRILCYRDRHAFDASTGTKSILQRGRIDGLYRQRIANIAESYKGGPIGGQQTAFSLKVFQIRDLVCREWYVKR